MRMHPLPFAGTQQNKPMKHHATLTADWQTVGTRWPAAAGSALTFKGLCRCLLQWLCVVWLLWPPHASAASELATVELPADFQHISLAGHWAASTPTHMPRDAAEALSQFQSAQFEQLPGNLARGFGAKDVWLAFRVKPHSTTQLQRLILAIQPAFLDRIAVYTAEPGQAPVLVGQAGDQVPKALQPLSASFPVVALTLSARAETTVLMHVQTTSTLAVMADLYEPGRFNGWQARHHLLMGSLFMACGLMLLSALGLYAVHRQTGHLYWAAYVAVTAGQWSLIDGQVFLWFDWADPTRINQLTTLFTLLSLAIGAVFTARVFEVQRIHPWLRKALLIWAWTIGVLGVAGLGLGLGSVVGLAILSGLPLLLGMPVVIAIQIHRRLPIAVWHGPLFIAYLLLVVLQTFSAMGWLPYTPFTLFGWQTIGALNLLSIQVFMFMQLLREQQSLLAQRSGLLDQLSAHNQDLSAQVAQRTQSLEKALAASQLAEVRFKHLLDNSVDVVWRLDADTLCFDYVSPSVLQQHGKPPPTEGSRMLGRNMPPLERERLQQLVRGRAKAFRAGELTENHVFTDELLQLHQNGNKVPVEVNSRFVLDPFTGVLWLQGISRDMTERKRLLRELEQSLAQLHRTEAGQRQLLTTLSHEFRTPAALIKASLDSLRIVQADVPEAVQLRIDNIEVAALRLRELCNNLLTLERLQQQSIAPIKTPVDLAELVRRVTLNHPESARIFTIAPGQPLILNLDATLITTMLNNLLDNACAHTKLDLSPLTVTLDIDQKNTGTPSAILRVADLGAGIPNEHKEAIFERHNSSSQDLAKGIGLAIVREIVRIHGGTVYAIDNYPTGTVFVLTLE